MLDSQNLPRNQQNKEETVKTVKKEPKMDQNVKCMKNTNVRKRFLHFMPMQTSRPPVTCLEVHNYTKEYFNDLPS